MTNIDEIVGESHKYVLFSNKLYQNKFIQSIRKDIYNLTADSLNEITETIDYLYKSFDEIAEEILTVKPELANEIVSTFLMRLQHYRSKARRKISNVVYTAYVDAKEVEENSIYRMKDNRLDQFLIINDKDNLEIEILVEDEETNSDKIFYLKGKSLKELFARYYLLNKFAQDIIIEFGYSDIFDSVYETFLRTESTYIQKLDKMCLVVNEPNIVDYINNLKIG